MIYLDHNATTPLDPEVRDAMDAAASVYGNPSSVHAEGQKARRIVEEARDEVARLLGARSEEIVLTAGGTEANALAIFGAMGGRKGRVVVSGAEHPSVREAAARLSAPEAGGSDVVTVNPEPSGALDPDRVLAAASPGTALVSVMAANNEYGALFPIARLGAELRRRGILFHTDAVQATGRIGIDVETWGVDLLSLSAHKFHGPKGAGALYVRKGVALTPHPPGGGQERRRRAGTENTTAIAGFGVAARLAARRVESDASGIAALRERLERGLLDGVERARVVGSEVPRLPNTSAILFEGVSGEALLIRLDLEGVAVSVGSACSSGTLAPSPALLALGLPREEARSVVRFSLGRGTTAAEIERAVAIVRTCVGEIRQAPAPLEARVETTGRELP
jgi:cysteine desulfurase